MPEGNKHGDEFGNEYLAINYRDLITVFQVDVREARQSGHI